MNPVLPLQHFVPDPEARRWRDGRMYIYGSYDISGDTTYCSYEYRVFSSADLLKWEDHGIAFKSSGADRDVPWQSGDLLIFAPDCIYKDGKYYLFFCMQDNSEGVAVSESPSGPFRDAVQVAGAHGDAIDPAAFLDDDGQVYLYWGQFRCRAARLKADLTGIEPETLQTSLINEEEHGFHEGASLRKRNGIYYLVYTDTSRGKASCLAYCTSTSPLGPFVPGGIIIDNDGCDPQTWNNHGSIAEFNGNWYVFYHRSSQGSKFSRRACIEPIHFNADGSIEEVEMTTQGVSAPMAADQRIEAWRACLLNGSICTEAVHRPGGEPEHEEHLAFVENGAWAAFKTVDFRGGADYFRATAASLTMGGEIEVRLDTPEGKLIGVCHVTHTGGWQVWEDFGCPVEPTEGVHAVYLVFRGRLGRLMNLKSFRFAQQAD